MALLIDIKHPDWMTDDELRTALLQSIPDADIRTGAAPGDPGDIEMLTVSTYLEGEAQRYPNLRLVQKTGAGVNAILADENLPPQVQVTRLETSTSGAEMAEYALAYVLQEQRHLRQYHAQQARAEWRSYPPRKAGETRVAVLGLGRIGNLVAQRFVDNGFVVSGWSRSPKQLAGIDCFAGMEQFEQAVADAAYVISVLPSTPATRGLFDLDRFGSFEPEALFINMGRGDLVDETGLMAALDQGRLAGAVLDVMSQEPLPSEHPLWSHPRIQLTPHISGYHLGDAIFDIAENYRRLRAGKPLLNLVDRSLGY